MKVLLATTNLAKLKYYGSKLIEQGIEVLTINDLDCKIDVNENGKNPLENAMIKAKAYYELTGFPTIAIDDGLYFEDVPDDIQPGTHVRRVNNKTLNDEEMLEYYLNLINKYGNNGRLKGFFLKSVVIIIDGTSYTHTYKRNKLFVNKVSPLIVNGYPLDSLSFEEEFNKYTSELSDEEILELEKINQDGIREFIVDTILREKETHDIRIK